MKKSHLLEASILPTWANQRPIGGLSYFWIWVGMAVMIAVFQLGAMGIAGLPLYVVIPVIFIGNVVLGIIMVLTADIGTEHGISFAVYLRAPFGIFGTHLPSVSRGIVAATWFGIQTYLGALAINGIVSYFIGFDSWVLWYVIFAIVQIVNTAMGIRAVKILANIAAPVVAIISIWMFFTLEDLAVISGKNIWTFVGDEKVSVFALFLASLAWWSALSVDIPNLTRFVKTEEGSKGFFKRNKNVFIPQLIALPVTQTWMAFVGAVSFVAAGDWNPINVIQEHSSGVMLIVLLLMITLAQWSTNTAANLIPAALTFVNAGAPRISYGWGIVISGIVGTLSMPWLLLDNLFIYLGAYGAVLSSVGAIMICDYYLLRGRRLNVSDLYEEKGQFRYMKGFNLAGFIAWIIGGSLALYYIQYAFLVGFIVAGIIYFILMKKWILPKYKQDEIVDPDDDKYLATSVSKNWVYSSDKGMQRLKTSDISEDAIAREDL